MNEEERESRLSTADLVAETDELKERRETNNEVLSEQKESLGMEEVEPLFEAKTIEDFRSRWLDIQTRFVDAPKESVRDADELVAEVIKNIAEIFAEERSYLEDQWKLGSEVSTEDLRISLTRYRSFFNRLLKVGK